MPWVNRNEELVYVPSKFYVKSDLPTYMEFVDFIKEQNYTYDAKGENERDKYWEVDKQKWLLAVCCNQINKMLHEDGLKQKAFHLLQENTSSQNRAVKYYDLRAMLHSGTDKDYQGVYKASHSHSLTDYPPNIYCVNKALRDPFLPTTNRAFRTDVTDWEWMELVFVELYATEDKKQHVHSIIDSEYWIHKIVTYIM